MKQKSTIDLRGVWSQLHLTLRYDVPGEPRLIRNDGDLPQCSSLRKDDVTRECHIATKRICLPLTYIDKPIVDKSASFTTKICPSDNWNTWLGLIVRGREVRAEWPADKRVFSGRAKCSQL